MDFSVAHEVPGRIRIKVNGWISEPLACALEDRIQSFPNVTKCVAYPKSGSLAVSYRVDESGIVSNGGFSNPVRNGILAGLKSVDPVDLLAAEKNESLLVTPPRPRHLFTRLATMLVGHFCRRLFLPLPLRTLWVVWSAIPFWKAALRSLRSGRLDVSVLDAAAITMGIVQGKISSSGGIMLLIRVGEMLEDYTQRRAEGGLIRSLLDLPDAIRVIRGDAECEIDLSELRRDDSVVVRMGSQIPVDGTVLKGEASVCQASLTGEPLPVIRGVGDSVYAGTVVEEGELVIGVAGTPETSKIRSIVSMVERSEELKSSDQRHIEHMADKLVPWNFLLALGVALVTRNLAKTSVALMVDYSCALRLSGSIAVMAAQREAAQSGFTVKGSKYFSRLAQADTIVFDKTGTLTQASPSVCEIVACNGWHRDEVLRLAACLEEHFPHPVARAVVERARLEGIGHRERHAEVEYVVAHGIASTLDGQRVVIGSEHFIVEDEGVSAACIESRISSRISAGLSPLFLAVDGVLRGVILIDDPLKEGIREALDDLRLSGIDRIVMLTGDNRRNASRTARLAGIDEYGADLLPEQKCAAIEHLQDSGCRAIMVGDGVNDSPALSRAYVSIAMGAGSAIAREAADVALVTDDVASLIDLRKLSVELERRMRIGYFLTVAVNTLLLIFGISGAITPQISSACHNAATIAIAASNTRRYLPGIKDS